MYSKKLTVLINTLIFTIAFNTPIFIEHYMSYKVAGNNAIYFALGEFIVSLLAVFPFIYALARKNLFCRALLLIVYIVSGLTAYFVYSFNISITSEIIAAFFESSKNEVLTFLTLDLILALIGSGFIGFICIFSVVRSECDPDQDKKLSFITIVFTLGCLFGDGDFVANMLPYNTLKETGTYWLEKTSIIKKRFDIAQNYQYKIDDSSAEDLNIILIIGESARGDHFSLSGYHRETNPLLAKESKNMAYFKDVTACYPLTRVAVPCMLTRATRENPKLAKGETSFIGVFKKLGFYTTWLGMQGTYSAIDAPYFDLAKESNKALLLGTDVDVFNTDDSSLFPFVDQFYKEHQKGKNLLILHTYGSHFHYAERYTKEFNKFKPSCYKKKFITDMTHCKVDEIIGSYDNSILYTDYFIKSIIDKVRDKNSLVIYTSDHGESLGENGRFLHGTYNAGEQIDVSMLFWASDKYINKFPDNIKNMREMQDKAILHDHLFHSILGCSGISSEVIQDKLNLCANKP